LRLTRRRQRQGFDKADDLLAAIAPTDLEVVNLFRPVGDIYLLWGTDNMLDFIGADDKPIVTLTFSREVSD
jgi:hypothetical protein